MYEAIAAELAKIRTLAELADEALLAYLIDVAIIEAMARSHNDSLETLIAAGLEPRPGSLAH